MSNRINLNWIKSNKDNLIKYSLVNGIGSDDKYSKVYKRVRKSLTNKDKSFFYDSSIVHDTLYRVGCTFRDRIRADYIFLKEMFKEINNKLKWYEFHKVLFYFIVANIYFLAVLWFGGKAFNYSDKKLTKKYYLAKFKEIDEK